jgi:hypothetical protein
MDIQLDNIQIQLLNDRFHIKILNSGLELRDIPINGLGNYNAFMCRQFLKNIGIKRSYKLTTDESYSKFSIIRNYILNNAFFIP